VQTILFVLLAQFLLVPVCVAQSWTPTVDTYGNSRAQYLSRDMGECRSMAQQASGGRGDQALSGAVRGGAVGAAGGAAIGAALGNAGRGAAIGAVAGGVGRGTRQANVSDAAFQRAFSNCLRNRGHNVLN
jgi:outer membrane lipoprotein SlyB